MSIPGAQQMELALSECTLDQPRAYAQRIGVFGCNDGTASRLAGCMRRMGKTPVLVHSYAALTSRSTIMCDIDCAVVSIHEPEHPGQLSRDTEEFIDLLFATLAAVPSFSAVIITPRSLASMVSYMFESQRVTLLIDAGNGDICSGLFQMVRCCGTGLADTEMAPAGEARAAIEKSDSAAHEPAAASEILHDVCLAEPSSDARKSGAAVLKYAARQTAIVRKIAPAADPLETVGSIGRVRNELAAQLCEMSERIDAVLKRLPDSDVTRANTGSGAAVQSGAADSGETRALIRDDLGTVCASENRTDSTPSLASGDHNSRHAEIAPAEDAKLLRTIIGERRRRSQAFDDSLFSDPAWDMMLDLALARAEGKRVSVSSLCIASGAPQTTALRLISRLVDAGLFVRIEDQGDKRRVFVALTRKAVEGLNRYLKDTRDRSPR